jgi:hypothetical protein
MLSKHEEIIMAKLTDTQLIILSNAAARDDGIAVVPPKMNKSAASKVGASLIARKLMRELRSKPGMPVWRQDDEGRSISLMITRPGRDAIGVDEEEQEAKQASPSDRKTGPRSLSPSKGDGSKSSASTLDRSKRLWRKCSAQTAAPRSTRSSKQRAGCHTRRAPR